MRGKWPGPRSLPINEESAGSMGLDIQTWCPDKDIETGRGHILTSGSICIKTSLFLLCGFAMYVFYFLTLSEVLGSCQFPKADIPGSYYVSETMIFFQ